MLISEVKGTWTLKPISVEEVYAETDLEEIPGFFATGEFRPPKQGEYYVDCISGVRARSESDAADHRPRIILRRIPEFTGLPLEIANQLAGALRVFQWIRDAGGTLPPDKRGRVERLDNLEHFDGENGTPPLADAGIEALIDAIYNGVAEK